ncbi:hypothetical protein ATANTOWER_022695, partial [Ataeniobius toweri]|nr:hypothetical protein [Ataeniobius toweri]
AQGCDPLIHWGKPQHETAELGGNKQTHPSSPPLPVGHSRVEESPAPLEEMGSRAHAVRGGGGPTEGWPRVSCSGLSWPGPTRSNTATRCSPTSPDPRSSSRFLLLKETEFVGEDSFESLGEFQVVLSELASDKSLDRIRVEYEKLIHALKKSRDNEKRLMSKCRELNAEIVSTSTKVAAALKLSQDDETTITSLKRELDKAWKMVDATHDKERKDMETIKNLKEDVSKLTKATEQQTGQQLDQERMSLIKMIEEMTQERDQLMTTVEDLREKLNKATVIQQEIEKEKETAVQSISKLQQELQVQQNEISREMRLKEKLDKEIQQLHADMEAKMAEIKALNMQRQKAKEEQQRLEQQLKDLKLFQREPVQ